MKKTKLAIIGENDFANNIVHQLLTNDRYTVSCFLTNKKQETNNRFNLPIYKIEGSKKYYKTLFDKILVLDDMPYESEFYYDLHKEGYTNIDIMIKESSCYFENGLLSKKSVHTFDLSKKPLLKYIEMHVTDICNLKCKGCTHFASLFHKDETSYESFVQDITELSNKFDVAVIRLMGGEALLNPRLAEYLNITRKKFPNSKLFLVSNGLLVARMTDKLCNSIKQNDITLNITVYKPTYDKIAEIEQFLSDRKISHFYGQGNSECSATDVIEKFHTCLTLSNNRTIEDSGFQNCYGKYCWMLRNGMLSKCVYPLLCYKLNEKFHTNFITTDTDICVLKDITDGWKIVKSLADPIPFCKYCSNESKVFDWKGLQLNPLISEYTKER